MLGMFEKCYVANRAASEAHSYIKIRECVSVCPEKCITWFKTGSIMREYPNRAKCLLLVLEMLFKVIWNTWMFGGPLRGSQE